MEPWWNCGGTVVEPWWNRSGTVVEPDAFLVEPGFRPPLAPCVFEHSACLNPRPTTPFIILKGHSCRNRPISDHRLGRPELSNLLRIASSCPRILPRPLLEFYRAFFYEWPASAYAPPLGPVAFDIDQLLHTHWKVPAQAFRLSLRSCTIAFIREQWNRVLDPLWHHVFLNIPRA